MPHTICVYRGTDGKTLEKKKVIVNNLQNQHSRRHNERLCRRERGVFVALLRWFSSNKPFPYCLQGVASVIIHGTQIACFFNFYINVPLPR